MRLMPHHNCINCHGINECENMITIYAAIARRVHHVKCPVCDILLATLLLYDLALLITQYQITLTLAYTFLPKYDRNR